VARVREGGAGRGEKRAGLLGGRTIARGITAHLIDVSSAALMQAERTLGELGDVVVVPHEATYESGLVDAAAASKGAGRTMVLFLGSNIGNFDRPGADAFLMSIRSTLSAGDAMLIGADMVKQDRDLMLAS